MQERIGHTRLKSEIKNALVSVNVRTGRLLAEIPALSIGSGSFKIDLSHAYNQGFNSTTNSGFIGHWKLNLEQSLINNGPARRDWTSYTYVDCSGISHLFVYLMHSGNTYQYHDTSGLDLILTTEGPDDIIVTSQSISDQAGNKLNFNLQGKLIETSSGTNQGRKVYVYENDFLTEIFDQRKESRKITFRYQNDLLAEVRYINNERIHQTYHYEYDLNNHLRTITRRSRKTDTRRTEHKIHIFYVENTSLISGIHDTRDGETVKIYYEANPREGINKVQCIETGFRKSPDIDRRGVIQVGSVFDIPFFGEINNGNFALDHIISRNTFEYEASRFNRTTVTDEKNVRINYQFNTLGFLVSSFELDGTNLRELQRRAGVNMLNPGNNSERINGETGFNISMNSSISTASNSIMNTRLTPMQDYRHQFSHCQFFTIGFYLRVQGTLRNNLVVVEIESQNDTALSNFRNEYYGSLDLRASHVWQYVEVQVVIPNRNLRSVSIRFPGGVGTGLQANIVGMKLSYDERNKLFVTASGREDCLEMIERANFTNAMTNQVSTSTSITNFFLTERDIHSTYMSLIERGAGNPFIFSACDGTVKRFVSNLTFITERSGSIIASLTNGEANYQTVIISPDERNIIRTTYHRINAHTRNSNPICLAIRTNAHNGDNHSSTEEWVDFKGRVLLERNERGSYTDYNYDIAGNQRFTVTNPNLEGETFTFSSHEGINSSTERSNLKERVTNFSEVFGEAVTQEFYGLKKEGQRDTANMLTQTHSHNEFSDRIEEVTNNFEGKNHLKHDRLGRLINLSPEMESSYSYAFDYDELNDFSGSFYRTPTENNQITDIAITRETSGDVIRSQYFRTIRNVVSDTITVSSNRYGQVTSTVENAAVTTFTRQSLVESDSIAQITQYRDPFHREWYSFGYSDANNITSYSLGNLLQFTISSTGISCFFGNFGISHGAIHQTGVYNFSYEDEFLLNPKIGRTNEIFRTVNNVSDFLDITYKYDGFGRPLSKTSVDITNIGASSEVRTTEESYEYHSGTVILRSIKGGRQFNFDYDNTNTINSRSYIESSRINVIISDTRHEIVAVYRYDLAGRLVQETDINRRINDNDIVRNYGYNNDGSLAYEELSGQRTNYNYESGRLRTITASNGASLNFFYDLMGNCTNYNGRICNFTRGNMLFGFDSHRVSFEYNNQGIRTRKTIRDGGHVIYYYDGAKLLAECDNNGNYLRYIYDANEMIGFVTRGYKAEEDIVGRVEFPYFFIKDTLGNVVGLRSDNHPQSMIVYEYDSWGAVTAVMATQRGDTSFRTITDPNHIALRNPIRWKSQYYDTQTELYYIEGRYYSPLMRQYITPLSPEEMISSAITPNSLNSYLLTVANPIDLVYNTSNIETTISLYMVTPLNGWFARRRAIISAWGDRKAAIVSRRVSSITNPVMDWWDGLDNWQKVAVGAGVLAAMTLATILTGGKAALLIKGTKKAKLVGASNASAWITAGAGLGGGAITGGWDGAADGFALGALGGAITGPAAKAIGLAKVGVKWKFAKHSAKVVGKGGVYFSASVGMQQIFFGNVCWVKAGTAGVFGMSSITMPAEGWAALLSQIGVSAAKEVTIAIFKEMGIIK